MSQPQHTEGAGGNMPGQTGQDKTGQAQGDSIGTGGSTFDGSLSHRDPLEGVSNAQTGVTTKQTDAYSNNQTSNLAGGNQGNKGSSGSS